MIQILVDDGGTIRLTQAILAGMPNRIRQVVRRASIDTIRAIRGEIPKAVHARWDISKSAIRSHMRLTTRSEDGGMRMGLVITGRRIPVIDFSVRPAQPPRQAGIPVSQRTPVKIVTVRGHPRVGQPNRFVARMPSGHVGVYMRKSGSKSLPIRESVSEAIPEMIRARPVRKQIEDRATEVFTKAVERNIHAVLEKT
jgi:hypothetical protein